MLPQYIDTGLYTGIIAFFGLLCALFVFLIIHRSRSILKEKRRGKRKKEEKLQRDRKIRHWLVSALTVFFAVTVFLGAQVKRYEIGDTFAPEKEERAQNEGTSGLQFDVVERMQAREKEKYEEVLHLEWYDELPDKIRKENGADIADGKVIDRKALNKYETNSAALFSVIPYREARDYETGGSDPAFEKRKENFKKLVASSHVNLDSKVLWKGFEDGLEVCKINDNSQNVFQTAVLAESACENIDASQQNGETCFLYTAGMVGQFEKYLEFSDRQAGDNIEVSAVEVSFRCGKMLYKTGREYEGSEKRPACHSLLFAHGCIRYAIDHTETGDVNYLKYLYYSGLICAGLLEYIDDGDLCIELCREELERWEELEEIGTDLSCYNREGKELEDIMKVKKGLRDRIG